MTEKNVTTDAAGKPTLAPSPKVIAGAVTGIGLAVVVAVLAAVTPDMLAPLGAWGTLIYAGVVALGASLAAYLKRP